MSSQRPPGDDDLSLEVYGGMAREQDDGSHLVSIRTSRGDIPAIMHLCEGGEEAIIWVCGAIGGFDGPAEGIYASLGQALVESGVTSLRLNYRLPNEFEECVLDTLGGVSFLKGIGASGVALVGHSFGGAVVIAAGGLSPNVKAVAALSSQTRGATGAGQLSPRPLLLVHGEEDTRLPPTCSQLIYDWAQTPKELVLIPGAGHSLRERREDLYNLLKQWLVVNLR